MAEVNLADLKPYPSKYQSSRDISDVLMGEDTGLSFINVSSTGDIAALQTMLEQSPEIALETPYRIYDEDRPAKDENDARGVSAKKISNLYQAILRAAENGHAMAVSTLLSFASRQAVQPSSVIDRVTIKKTIENGHVAVFEVLATTELSVITTNILHGQRALDLAIKLGNTEIASVALRHGGDRENPEEKSRIVSYMGSRLSKAAGLSKPDMTELLVEHGHTVKGSGALQMAADRNALDTIRLLVEKHGADVDEILPAETLPVHDNALLASWTPMHFAARWRKEEAMKLLESYGAKTDVVDVNGMTAWQLLKDRRDAVERKKM